MLIEIHAHVICGVDDGARTEDEMQRMLYMAADSGTEVLFCTSHVRPGIDEFPLETYRRNFKLAEEWCAEHAPQLRLLMGAEILYTPQTAYMLKNGWIPTLGDSKMILLELPSGFNRNAICKALSELRRDGWIPVLAHVERCRALRSDKRLRELRTRFGVLTQVNAQTVFSQQGFFRRRWLNRVLNGNLIDFVASDAHDCSERIFCLKYAHHWLAQNYGQKTADDLCGNNIASHMRAAGVSKHEKH